MNIIEEIKIEMLRQKYKQKDLAENLKVSRVHISKVMNGADCRHSLILLIVDELGLELILQKK